MGFRSRLWLISKGGKAAGLVHAGRYKCCTAAIQGIRPGRDIFGRFTIWEAVFRRR